ncbi:Vacuolar protein sorting-associated protein 41 [Malassezia yamatoensis]|uniref:Vacuolar protein sorting-associated protein 41 n=1 Tax=Malassezia yamatoensis TaxID=253288 RepID=A0AAJ5YUF3_9BASI|nr:Vacuolar protein sorting-associated protein 41 [Malassezia yamatoensis]
MPREARLRGESHGQTASNVAAVSQTEPRNGLQSTQLPVGSDTDEKMGAASNSTQRTRADRKERNMSETSDPQTHISPLPSEYSQDELSSKASSASDSVSASIDAQSTTSSCDEEEPLYNIHKIGSSVQDILAKDTLTASAVNDKHIAIGTSSGMLYVVTKEGLLHKGFQFHTAKVQQVVLDSTGTFIASAGMDGLVCIASLHTSEQYRFDFQRPMQTIALEPGFGNRSSRAFVCGGMNSALVHREKRWFGHKETILHSGEGPIWTLSWHDRWIAWANDRGVRVLDVYTHNVITLIASPQPSIRMELARCHLFWRDPLTLLIAQGQRITVANIRSRFQEAEDVLQNVSSLSTLIPNLNTNEPNYFAEITEIFQVDYLVSGIAYFQDRIITLAYRAHPDDLQALHNGAVRYQHDAQLQELCVIDDQGEEIGSDLVYMDDVHARCNDLHLASCWLPKKSSSDSRDDFLLYVAGRRTMIVAQPRTEKDHLEWLLERHEYGQVLEQLERMGKDQAQALELDYHEIGREYLHHLIEEQHDYSTAASNFARLLGNDAAAWEEFLWLYLDRHELDAALPYIPTQEPQLSEVVYDMVLVHLLHTDERRLLQTLRTWPAELYSRQAVAAAIQDRASSSSTLVACLAELFLAGHAPGKALQYLLQLRDPTVFALIREHNLFTDVQDKLAQLVELDQDIAGTQKPPSDAVTPLLVDHQHSIPIQRAMSQLDAYPWYAYHYLDALFDRDPESIGSYANQLVSFYAEYQYSKLMSFLRTMSSMYSFEKAYKVCVKHDYVPEMIFLLGRTGDTRGALNLIIERLHDVHMAIDFVKQQDDTELWDQLLVYSRDRPEFLRALLEQVGGEVDFARIMRNIPENLTIPGLKPAVIKALHTMHLQASLLDDCSAVQFHAVQGLVAQYDAALRAARYCDAQTRCIVCDQLLLVHAQPAMMFFCFHSAHLKCITSIPSRFSDADPFMQPTRSFSGTYADNRRAWLSLDQTSEEPDFSSLSSQTQSVQPTNHAKILSEAQKQALQRTKQLHTLPLAQSGCPICAQRQAYSLE